MVYTKIRIDLEDGPKNRFYRVVLVKGDPDLFELGTYFGLALGATFEHCFLFENLKRDKSYVMGSFLEDRIFDGDVYLRKYHLSELDDTFRYVYDTGDGWNFICKRYKTKVNVKSKQDIILVSGEGQGIWEDNIHSLWALFDGDIDPEDNIDYLDEGIVKPWNFEIEKYGDFDLPLDTEKMNEELANARDKYDELLEQEIKYIESSSIDVWD